MKNGRLFALGFVCALAWVVPAGAQVVEVVLTEVPTGPHLPDAVITVEVSLQRVAVGDPIPVRMIQLDTSVSDVSLGLVLPTTHDLDTGVLSDDIHFFSFDSLAGCTLTPGVCGQDHYFEDELGGTRPNVISMAYLGLDANQAINLTVPGDMSPVKVGEMEVTLPSGAGLYKLDFMNATEGDPDVGGAEVHGSFDAPLDPFRAGGDLIGGTIALEVGSACANAGLLDLPALSASKYPCDSSLSRVGNNILRYVFDIDVDPPAPSEIEVRELLDGGLFGLDLSAFFDISIEGTTVLKVAEIGEVLLNETWYAVINTGAWCSAEAFQVDYVTVFGDANNSGDTSFTDLSAINSFISIDFSDDSRFDINTIANVSFADLSAANSFIPLPTVAPAKPSGHVCSP